MPEQENARLHLVAGRSTGSDPATKTSKGERTRARILETALELFRRDGYEATTMRVIASTAGVSLGNAYYYFNSKEHLIQAFYARTHDEHLAACSGILESSGNLKTRLLGVMRAKLGTSMPYHRFSGLLFRTAADPSSPLNPFSSQSRPVREESIDLFRSVVLDSTTKVPAVLAKELPGLLWLYQMGVILYWIHDTSPGCDKSYRLVDRSVDLVVRLIKVSANPLMRPIVRSVMRLVSDLKPDSEDEGKGEKHD